MGLSTVTLCKKVGKKWLSFLGFSKKGVLVSPDPTTPIKYLSYTITEGKARRKQTNKTQ